MRKTPQQFKRLEVKQVIDKILKEAKTNLKPLSINVGESLADNFTTTDFSFEISGSESKIVSLENQRGKGFVDGLFMGLKEYFSAEYKSITSLALADYNVNPLMSKSNIVGTDAQASVLLSVCVEKNGVAEFQHTSRSMIYSSYFAALEAFQFYINCDRCFQKIQIFLKDAQKRNRGDIMSQYVYDLSKLTEVNNYEKEKV